MIRHQRLCWPAACGTAAALFAGGPAAAAVQDAGFGSSPIPIGAGPRALGMGGAFSAVADDATADSWNPGGMIQLERLEVAASAGAYGRRVQQDDGSASDRWAVDLDHAGMILPFNLLSCQQTLGISWQRQFDFTRRVGEHFQDSTFGLLGDHIVDLDQHGSFATWSLSYAIELTPGLGLGITGSTWADRLTGRSHYDREVFLSDQFTDPLFGFGSTSTISETRATKVVQGFQAVVGAWWQVAPALTAALVVKPTYHLGLRTVVDAAQTALPAPPGGTPPIHDQFDSTFYYPTSVTAGLAWRRLDRDTVAVDATWTQWSHYRIRQSDGTTTSPIDPSVDYQSFSDNYSVRLGWEHIAIFDEFALVTRTGLIYEGLPGVTEAATTDPGSAGPRVDRYYGAALGFSLVLDRVTVDMAGQVRYGHRVGTNQDTAPDQATNVIGTTIRSGITVEF